MVESKKDAVSEPAVVESRARPVHVSVLGSAAESSDAGVHNLLAARAICELNGDKAGVTRVDKDLAALGVAV